MRYKPTRHSRRRRLACCSIRCMRERMGDKLLAGPALTPDQDRVTDAWNVRLNFALLCIACESISPISARLHPSVARDSIQ